MKSHLALTDVDRLDPPQQVVYHSIMALGATSAGSSWPGCTAPNWPRMPQFLGRRRHCAGRWVPGPGRGVRSRAAGRV